MSPPKIPVTVIILTYNEAINMAPCLTAMVDADDVVVVDSNSRDETISAAKEVRSDVRIFYNPFKDFGEQRNWALDNTSPKHEWVLFVDADEYCTVPFLDELRRFLADPGESVGAFVAGKNHFFGRWLLHCTMYPSYQLRLLRLGQVRFRKEGHGQREVTDGKLVYFKAGWVHNAMSKGLHQWLERHNQYSTDEAELLIRLRGERLQMTRFFTRDAILRRRALKQLAARLPMRSLARFLYVYILRGGFLDGAAGFRFCALRFAHDIHMSCKVSELRRLQRSDDAIDVQSTSDSSLAAKSRTEDAPVVPMATSKQE